MSEKRNIKINTVKTYISFLYYVSNYKANLELKN